MDASNTNELLSLKKALLRYCSEDLGQRNTRGTDAEMTTADRIKLLDKVIERVKAESRKPNNSLYIGINIKSNSPLAVAKESELLQFCTRCKAEVMINKH